jgi:hypothetical protein
MELDRCRRLSMLYYIVYGNVMYLMVEFINVLGGGGIRGDECGVASRVGWFWHNLEGQSHQRAPCLAFANYPCRVFFLLTPRSRFSFARFTSFFLVSRQPSKCPPPSTEFNAGEQSDG